MADDFAWVSLAVQHPEDRQVVYARVKNGKAHRVTFHASPSPRWVIPSMVFQFEYFAEWAALESAERKPPKRSE